MIEREVVEKLLEGGSIGQQIKALAEARPILQNLLKDNEELRHQLTELSGNEKALFEQVKELQAKLSAFTPERIEEMLRGYITNVSLYHDKECGRITNEQIIFKARFLDLATEISKFKEG